MGRRRRKNTLQRARLNEAAGRGCYTSKEYVPGINTYEFPSQGKTARLLGVTTNRVHQCMSQLEKYFLLLLDYNDKVTDIREQV